MDKKYIDKEFYCRYRFDDVFLCKYCNVLCFEWHFDANGKCKFRDKSWRIA